MMKILNTELEFGGMWWLGVVAAICASLWIWRLHSSSSIRSRSSSNSSSGAPPAGPPALPLLGHFHLLLTSAEPPHALFTRLARRFGPLVRLQLGCAQPVLLVSSKEGARAFLRTLDTACSSRSQSTAAALTMRGDLVFSPYGERWRQLRRLCAVRLFGPRSLDASAPLRCDELRSLLRSIRRSAVSGGQPGAGVVRVRDPLTAFSFNIISMMVMGQPYFGRDDAEAKEFTRLTGELTQLLGDFAVGDYFPWLWWMDSARQRMRSIAKALDRLLERIIAQREQQPKEASRSAPFVDVMLKLRDEGEACMQDRKTIKGLLLNLFIGGSDTSSLTAEWTLAELIKHPKVMSKLQQELDNAAAAAAAAAAAEGDSASGSLLLREQDVLNLPYLKAVVNESMRLHPVVPLLLPHFTMEDCEAMGFKIGAGTQIIVNAYAIGRDPSLWEDPLEFRPERFMNSSLDTKGHDFELLPFGSGRRICPGMSLGNAVVYLALANLVRHFDWKMPPGDEVDTVSERFGATLPMAKPLLTMAVPRTGLACDF